MTPKDAPRRRYWLVTRRLTAALLLVWGLTSFLPGWYAEDLNELVFFGWPLGFYLSAQGALIIFLLIVWFFDLCMFRLEQRLKHEEGPGRR